MFNYIRFASATTTLPTLSLAISLFGAGLVATPAAGQTAQNVIYLSIDGLRPDAIDAIIAEGTGSNFARLQRDAIWTHEARTDTEAVFTLPNHTSMLTGRPTFDQVAPLGGVVIPGHSYVNNADPEDFPTVTLPGVGTVVSVANIHDNRPGEAYVPSVYDVLKQGGKTTALFVAKDKLDTVFNNSYDTFNGASGDGSPVPFEGQNLIDFSSLDSSTNDAGAGNIVDTFVQHVQTNGPQDFTFMHIRNPDSTGHEFGWVDNVVDQNLTPEYKAAVSQVDGYLGVLLNEIENGGVFNPDTTTLIITADHGGGATFDDNHGNPAAEAGEEDFTIPFYVFGAGVVPGDLYAANTLTRAFVDGVNTRYPVTGDPALLQPIRNADGGNLALELLGLDPIPTSFINADQNLAIPEPTTAALLALGGLSLLARRRRIA